MNVLQLAYKSEVTGGEQVLLQLCRALIANGDTVTVVCPEPGPLGKLLLTMGISVEYVSMSKTYNLFAALKIRNIIKKRNIDIVHTHGMLVNILGRIATAISSKVKCISTVHMNRNLKNSNGEKSIKVIFKNKYYYRCLDNFTSRFCSKVIAVSYGIRKDLIQQGYREKLITVIQNGIDPAPFDQISQFAVSKLQRELQIEPNQTTISMVARLSVPKDIPFFIKAMAQVCKKHHNVRAFIAGDGPQKQTIKKVLEEYMMQKNITLLGYRTDVPVLLKATDIFALSSRGEGLPICVLEAMACKKPIVSAAVSGVTEVLADEVTGLLVKQGNVEAMAKSLCRLVESPELRTKLGAAGRLELNKKFHINRVASTHLGLYESVLNNEE